MSGPVRLRDILAHLCGCGGTAIIRYQAGRHGDHYRAIQACRWCAPAARAWAARAGPITETRLAPPDEAAQEDTETLF